MVGTRAFVQGRAALLADRGLRGLSLARAHSELVDAWLAGLLGGETGVALVAVGGYGRRQLFPAGDLDVVLVHAGRRDVGAVAERLWYPVWDAHLALDHSVRTVGEALALAARDLRVALGLLDARLVAGDTDLAGELAARARRQWQGGARRWLPQLERAVAERHEREGEIAFLLSPDLKEGRGGLRDLHALAALALACPAVPGPAGDPALDEAAAVLSDARAELHRQAGRAQDRLLLEEQDGVASALGLPDADALMAGVAGAARAVAWASDDAWRRARSWLEGPSGRVAARDRPLGPGLVMREGEVTVAGGEGGAGPGGEGGAGGAALADPTLALRAAEAAARSATRLPRATLAALAAGGTVPGEASPWPPEARQALVSLLGAGRAAVPVLEDLDQAGLLVRLVPEWALVRNRPQRNAYHRYTVDRHLLEAAAEAAALVRRVHRPDLLLVAAWLHDIGKGSPGDHSEAGAALAAAIGHRLGFRAPDVAVIASLVRHHLLLADTATRRDLADPATTRGVAEALGDVETLHLLACLTEADGLATGESSWTSWKQGLVGELVGRTAAVMEGQRPEPLPAFPLPRHRDLVARAGEEPLVVGEGDRMTVVAPDRPGWLSLVAGALALEGLAVVSADAWSGEGVAVSEHVVVAAAGGHYDVAGPDWAGVGERLRALARNPEALSPALARRARAYPRRRPRGAGAPAPRVRVDTSASDSATVVEVWAEDDVGLLHRIAGTFARLGLDIRHAKVQTLGHEVVDTFYLTGPQGGPVRDRATLEVLEAEVLAGVRGAGGPEHRGLPIG